MSGPQPAPPGPVVGLGLDLVDVERMRRALERTPGLATRVFTEAERELAAARHDRAEALAVRFAAKEAVLKALGAGIGAARLHDIEVVRAESGAPSVHLRASAHDLARQRGVATWLLSLTHTGGMAAAVAVATAAPVASWDR